MTVEQEQAPTQAQSFAQSEAPAHHVRYLNRELSWLRFNRRVLEEALDRRRPLLERVRFLGIYSSNLDEFHMVRVSGLRKQLSAGVVEPPPDGMTPKQQLQAIREHLLPELELAQRCWQEDLCPRLRQVGISVVDHELLKSKAKKRLRAHFKSEIFPVLTPLAFDPGHPFPHISSLSLNLAVVVNDPDHGERFGRIKVPQTIDRLVPVPSKTEMEDEGLGAEEENQRYVWLEQVVAANLDLLFPGLEILAAYTFRVTRDADFEIEEDEASDLLTAMAEVVGRRHFGSVVRLEVDRQMPDGLRQTLVRNLDVGSYQVYANDRPVGLAALSELAAIDRPDLLSPPFQPERRLKPEESVFERLADRDLILYHPYDSFSSVVDFVREAAADPDVVAIKQTLYRVGPNSPIVDALMQARENGKQVATLVELKARFDEENNIVWAQALEKAGVHVVYGVLGLKTHAKMCLVVRREGKEVRSYIHLSSGNYNPISARHYSDVSLLTSDRAIASDAANLFNALTGYSRKRDYNKLLVAPGNLRRQLVERIEREIRSHRALGAGHLAFKMNSLADKECIDALYSASCAGVQVDLQVRGICCLRPGLTGLSENIRVTSLVGRFLEHSRIYYFRNGGDEELLVGSADLMPRNLDHRVEVLFPIEDPVLKAAVRDDILFLHLRDDVNVRVLGPDGEYSEKPTNLAAESVDSVAALLERGGLWRV